MPTVGTILDALTRKAPLESKLDFDNVGLLAGDADWETDKVLLSLDITLPVINEAARLGAGLIISHHPLFFSLKAVNTQNSEGFRTLRLLQQGIAAICMHTNLDAADGGVNDALAAALELCEAKPFESEHICRLGLLREALPLSAFLPKVKAALGANGLRYVDAGRRVLRVAVGGGSCGSMLEEAAAVDCDTFVTADVKYDVFLRAAELGINLIDAGHFCTENVVLPVLEGWLREAFPGLQAHYAAHRQIEQYYL